MVTPPASSKPCFLEKVARSTLVLCHAFPQERPTGRSGTASAGSGKSVEAEVPSFFRVSSWRLGRLFTAGAAPILPTARGFVYQTQERAKPGRPRVRTHNRRSARDSFGASTRAAILAGWRANRPFSPAWMPPPSVAAGQIRGSRDQMLQRPIIPLKPAASPTPLPSNGKRFHVWTIGCQMNEADSAKIAAALQEAGYSATSDEEAADIVILNSCVVRQAAEDKVAGKLNSLLRLKRERPEVSVVLTGCMVTNQQQQLRERFPHVDLFFDPSDFAQLEQVAPEVSELSDDLADLPHYYADPGAATSSASAFVPIIYGCNFLCSYCIVPYRRGKERSRPVTQIVAEVERLVAGGVREITLLGQTVNAYGHDLAGNPGLADLLRAMGAVPGIARLRFLTSHPKYMSDDIIEAMAALPSVCEHMNLPVQAGDNDVLRRMRRTYTRDYWFDRIQFTRERMPEATVATDIIVGFPGETETQFLQTFDLLERTRCDKVHLAMYSPRPGTLSARWEDDVPHAEKQRRHRELEKLQERIQTEINAERLGQTYEVLVEGRSKGRWTGRTRGNTLMHFDDERDLTGKLVDVKVTRTTPWFLMGEPVSAPR
jgi:tRNA-2-methylthio-N6-dimethylallyladenosine synthase